jgi:2-keto-4-pentenoate hydratase/2-oxohepta-3-ene-1,7-dioic acid hydratase in catechol pathway
VAGQISQEDRRQVNSLTFELPDGSRRTVEVRKLLNAGYAGREQDQVAAHVAELAELGVPAPTTVPALYPVASYLAQQTAAVPAQHARTSGEAEWAIVVDADGDVLLTAACDHTDRALEAHGVAWSKNAAPDVLARRAWRLADVADRIDSLTLRSWVTAADGGTEQLLQDGTAAELLPPAYWVDVLRERGELEPGTVLLSGTIPMRADVDQFAGRWRAELADPATGATCELSYDVVPLPVPID